MTHSSVLIAFCVLNVATMQADDGPRVILSLAGDTLRSVPLKPEVLERRLTQLAVAQGDYDANPEDPDAIIWLGRRTAYLGRYREAIDIFTTGIELHPADPKMYRHRGHRYITVREFDRAIADLTRAAELTAGREDAIEPDGLPNALNIPTSTLQSNIWYHLGLARYLIGDFAGAGAAYAECMKRSENNDMLVATVHWYYMTLRRLGRIEKAAEILNPIHGEMEIIENDGYFRLLLFYKGLLGEEALNVTRSDGIRNATVGYGLATWFSLNGEQGTSEEMLGRIIQTREWAAFGYIAAEADLFRRR